MVLSFVSLPFGTSHFAIAPHSLTPATVTSVTVDGGERTAVAVAVYCKFFCIVRKRYTTAAGTSRVR